jgi:hypothetical protein
VPPVQFLQPAVEIVVDQRDRQVGFGLLALHDVNAQRLQGGTELGCALHVDRLKAHTAFLETALRGVRQQAEARPIGADGAAGRTRCRNDKTAIEETLQRFLDFVGRKVLFQRPRERSKTFATLSYRGGESAIELAVQEELAVLGIEAHDIGWQHVDGEIRRELRDVFAVRNVLAVMPRRAFPAIGCLAAGTRARALFATGSDRHCKARILALTHSHWAAPHGKT